MGKKEDIVIDYLLQPEVFAELFNGYVFDGEPIIRPEHLKEADGRLRFFLTNAEAKGKKDTYEIIKRQRDIVKEVTIGEHTLRLAVFGIEHQSEIDYSMVLRTLTYDTLEYLKQAKAVEQKHRRQKDVSGREFLSGFEKNDVLVPTITILFYTGRESWDAAMDLKGMFGNPPYLEKLLPYMVAAPLNLISVYNVEDTDKYHGSLKKIFDLVKYVEDGKAMLDFVHNNREAYSSLDDAAMRLISLLINMNLPEKESQEKEESDVCKALEDIREMGISEGISQGETMKLISQICRKLAKGKTVLVIAEELEEDMELVKRICEAAEPFAPEYDVEKIYEALQIKVA